MDMRWLLLTLFLIACAAICWAEESSEDKDGDQSLLADDLRAINDEDDKRVFRYGRSPGVFRYGKRGHGVFRYGKRGPGVFRYGKRADVDDEDTAAKRIFRWGKRDDVTMDEAAKRLLRWGKRFDDDDVSNLYDTNDYDDDVKRMIFRYGKRDDVNDKRRLFSFGKRNNGNHVISEVDLRSDSPHVPFRFGEK